MHIFCAIKFLQYTRLDGRDCRGVESVVFAALPAAYFPNSPFTGKLFKSFICALHPRPTRRGSSGRLWVLLVGPPHSIRGHRVALAVGRRRLGTKTLKGSGHKIWTQLRSERIKEHECGRHIITAQQKGYFYFIRFVYGINGKEWPFIGECG